MFDTPRNPLLVRSQIVLLLCLIGSGCVGTAQLREPEISAPVATASLGPPRSSVLPERALTPHTQIIWTIQTVQNNRPYVLSGKSAVNGDGQLWIGPYGSVSVHGLQIEQAQQHITQHLARIMPQPQVRLEIIDAHTVAHIRQPQAVNANTLCQGPSLPGLNQSAGSSPNLHRPAESCVDVADPGIVPASYQTVSGNANNLGDPRSYNQEPQRDHADVSQSPPLLHAPSPMEAGKVLSYPGHPTPGLPCSAPHELAKVPLPPYVIEPPDILLVESTQGLRDQPIRGQHLVRPDGTIGLGIYGSVFVAGMTIEEAKYAIGQQLSQRIRDLDLRNLNVDVLAYNSKFYYIITDGGGFGEQVYRVPYTGNETVLDALSQINGLPPVASKKHIWVARRAPGGHCPSTLPVDWCGITQKGCTNTNYQLLPGDRIYVKADKLIKIDNVLSKCISPVERLFGITLLGSVTHNSIQAGNAGGRRGAGFGLLGF